TLPCSKISPTAVNVTLPLRAEIGVFEVSATVISTVTFGYFVLFFNSFMFLISNLNLICLSQIYSSTFSTSALLGPLKQRVLKLFTLFLSAPATTTTTLPFRKFLVYPLKDFLQASRLIQFL